MKSTTIYYEPIAYQSIFKNDNWKKGGHASTRFADTRTGKPMSL